MRKTIDFLLNDWLDVASLGARDRYSEHSPETFASVLDTCQRIADEKFAPFNRLVDAQEPRLDVPGMIRNAEQFEAWSAANPKLADRWSQRMKEFGNEMSDMERLAAEGKPGAVMRTGAPYSTWFNGGIRNSEQEYMAQLLRRKAKVLVAFGSCACRQRHEVAGRIA